MQTVGVRELKNRLLPLTMNCLPLRTLNGLKFLIQPKQEKGWQEISKHPGIPVWPWLEIYRDSFNLTQR